MPTHFPFYLFIFLFLLLSLSLLFSRKLVHALAKINIYIFFSYPWRQTSPLWRKTFPRWSSCTFFMSITTPWLFELYGSKLKKKPQPICLASFLLIQLLWKLAWISSLATPFPRVISSHSWMDRSYLPSTATFLRVFHPLGFHNGNVKFSKEDVPWRGVLLTP